MPSTPAYYVEHDERSKVLGGYDLESAIDVARQLKQSGRSVRAITHGSRTVLEGQALAERLR